MVEFGLGGNPQPLSSFGTILFFFHQNSLKRKFPFLFGANSPGGGVGRSDTTMSSPALERYYAKLNADAANRASSSPFLPMRTPELG